MKILSWNSRGSAWDGFVAQTRFYVSCVDVDVLCILDTRAPFDSISNKLKNLPFDKSYGIAASGQCGGLTVHWKSKVVKIDVIEPHDRFIHCLLKDLVTSKSFYATFVYAYPQKDRQAAFWSVVAQLQPANQEGWVLIGDFNAITTLDEKLGGNQVVTQYMVNFCDFLNNSIYILSRQLTCLTLGQINMRMTLLCLTGLIEPVSMQACSMSVPI